MRKLKKFLLWFFGILALLCILAWATGNAHLFKGVANTYLKGRSGPSIDEYHIFSYNTIHHGTPQPWPISARYNKSIIASELLKEFEAYQTVAFLVIQHDSILHEEYWDGGSDTSHTNSFSAAKSIVGMLTGVAIQDGAIKSLDEPVVNYLPEFAGGNKDKVTVRHLLTMSSGINFDEDYVSPFAYPAKAYYGSDLSTLTSGYQVTEEPGKVFKYLSGNTALLSFVLKKATGKSLSDYATEKLWKPIGAEQDAYWSLDHESGVEKAYCCFNSNARDFARLGKLYLHNGNWNGKQLIDSSFVTEAITPADLADENGGRNEVYGYSWWVIKDFHGHKIGYARGILGQYIFVIPDLDMVVVRLGKKRSKERIGDHPKDAFVYLEAAEKIAKAND
jgi:CubicO group peptidase (beta-lactamase class C family)